MTQPAYSRLHSELWNRQWQALQRCKPTALVVAASQRRAAEQQLQALDQKPPEVAGCALYPHQLQVHMQAPAQGSALWQHGGSRACRTYNAQLVDEDLLEE